MSTREERQSAREIYEGHAEPNEERIAELKGHGFAEKDARKIDHLERQERAHLEVEREIGLTEDQRLRLCRVQEDLDYFRETAERLYRESMIERLRNERLSYLCELRGAEATLEDLLSDYEVGKPVDESRAARVARAILDTPSTS